MVGNVLSVFRLPPQQKANIPHLLLTTCSFPSSMAASMIVRFSFENVRPTRVSVLPLPANLSA